jgi:hypothetical protein
MRQLFDEVVGTPPPSDLDIRALVRRERGRTRRRRGLLGLAVVAVVAVTAVTQVGGPEPATRVAGPEPAVPQTFQLVVNTQEAADATADKVSEALDSGLHRVGAHWRDTPDDLIKWADLQFSGGGAITRDGRDGGLMLQIVTDHDPCPPGSPPEKACGDNQPSRTATLLTCGQFPGPCTESISPNGMRMVTREVSDTRRVPGRPTPRSRSTSSWQTSGSWS